VNYDYETINNIIDQQILSERQIHNIWRYHELLPLGLDDAVTLGEGFTPLIKAKNMERTTNLQNLRLKLDFTCPTGSFKDRGASIMISKAKQLGVKTAAIDSSGNAAAAIASYSAKANLQCCVFAPSYASTSKLVQSQAYGATVFAVEGTRGETYETAKAAYQHFGWYYCGYQTNTYATEGLKTIAYEICEQRNWSPPRWIIFPVGTGGNLVGCWKGLKELCKLVWITELPSLICVQGKGCAPIVEAFKSNASSILPTEKAKTIAEGLMIAHPLKGRLVLKALSETEGVAETVTDQEILLAGKLLAKNEGIFVEPSAAVAIAGATKLSRLGTVTKDDSIVCVLTGSGLKTREVYARTIGKPTSIRPGLDDLLSHTFEKREV
jgi:threonine synthase